MSAVAAEDLATLYAADETAWLDAMATLARRGEVAELDLENLSEYLTNMAQRDRREVKSRLALLIAHLLKWEFQPEKRTRSWQSTVVTQRQELVELAGRGVLHAYAESILSEAYANAIEQVTAETALPATTFPAVCRYSLADLLTVEFPKP